MEAVIVIVIAYFIVRWCLRNAKEKDDLKRENEWLKHKE